MALTPEQQAIDAFKRSTAPLIITRRDWTIDGIAAALALGRLLGRMGSAGAGKRVEIVVDGFAPPSHLAFLPGIDAIRPELGRLRQFIIALDVSKAPLDELYYHVEDGRLRITVTPKTGDYQTSDLSGAPHQYRHDLIIAVDVPDRGAIGAPANAHAEFFREVPTVTIGHDPAHERFGAITVADLAATSTTEALYYLFASTGAHFLDPEVATCLLAGIISRTRSFRGGSVTPKTLETAATLVAAGARREEIVRNLYRTRTVSTLKLWGRALARLGYDAETRTVWSVLTRQDFVSAGADDTHLTDVVDELMANVPNAEIFCLIHERHDGAPGIRGIVTCEKRDPASLVRNLPHDVADRRAIARFEGNDLVAAETQLLASIRSARAKTH